MPTGDGLTDALRRLAPSKEMQKRAHPEFLWFGGDLDAVYVVGHPKC